ncbi:hypothetical protein GCM10011613_35850 [Cellvibrio zantedeschiae]|uniref:VOC domain-containing protein n=1 Tax=Cellvibrio zantedeschiae TaxID=1237077 RepID=A0ABQ3BEP1_9GAMM|nr:hypothetical protein [Cellvibrio zantedeschiae]GGY87486.1 hypothetical protein GCM10011613_35850 [Cellvibrio zantedeschiae]
MVYINLSVINIEETINFFTTVLRIFDVMGTRLVCNSGIKLIIDIHKAGSESHLSAFDTNTHVPLCFGIHHGECIKIKILNHLKELEIEHDFTSNIAGELLKLKDPSGNRITIMSHYGGIL